MTSVNNSCKRRAAAVSAERLKGLSAKRTRDRLRRLAMEPAQGAANSGRFTVPESPDVEIDEGFLDIICVTDDGRPSRVRVVTIVDAHSLVALGRHLVLEG